MMWDFWSNAPESLHRVTMLFSDRGTPDGYRHMDGFGSHTFSLIDAEATAWESKTGWNPFDVTKVWPYGDFPRIPVGVLELNRNPDNYHQHVEQVAFSPANVVPGLGYSPDKMLQGRLFAYHDAQLHRVGTSHQHLLVNRPRCPFNNQQRDGQMAIDNAGSDANYANVKSSGTSPTSFGHGDPGWALSGIAGHYDERGASDDFTQTGNLFRVMKPDAQDRLTGNIAGAMKDGSMDVKTRQIAHFSKADPAYGAAVARKLAGMGSMDLEVAKALSAAKEA